MPKVSEEQLQRLKAAHAAGMLDRDIARHAGISLSTTKRYRKVLSLETHCVTTQRGKLGERVTALYAAEAGLNVTWRTHDNDHFDLIINGQKTDAKASMMLANGTWKFRLREASSSFFGQYTYPKDIAHDCAVVSFVCLYPDGREPAIYLMPSAGLPTTVRIRPGDHHEVFKGDWSRFTATSRPLKA